VELGYAGLPISIPQLGAMSFEEIHRTVEWMVAQKKAENEQIEAQRRANS
jgi:hypothetical protein